MNVTFNKRSRKIDFKVILLVFKALHDGQAPAYPFEFLNLFYCCLKSADQSLLIIPRSQFKSRGDWTFSIVGPAQSRVCSSLSEHVPKSIFYKTHI